MSTSKVNNHLDLKTHTHTQPVIKDEVELAGEQGSLCFCYYLVVNMSFQVRQSMNPEEVQIVINTCVTYTFSQVEFILFGVGLQLCC